jgi:hypothetical protein
VDHLYNKLFIKEKKLKLKWAKSQLDRTKFKGIKRTHTEMESKEGQDVPQNQEKLVIKESKNYYPSMDPDNYVSIFASKFNLYSL